MEYLIGSGGWMWLLAPPPYSTGKNDLMSLEISLT